MAAMAELSLALDLIGKHYFTGTAWTIETTLFRNVHYVDRNSKMTTTAGHSFYIGPIGSF